MDDLKTRVWDYLYKLGRADQVEVISQQLNEAPQAIQNAIENSWFDQHDGWVSIAQSGADHE